MSTGDQESSEHGLLYGTFHPLEELGNNGMWRVSKVRAYRGSKGFNTFLASSIAWQEVMQHKDAAPFSLRITALNGHIRKLMDREAELMDRGKEEKAELVRSDIDKSLVELREQVETLKKKQLLYLDKRSSQIDETDPETMIKYLEKIGLPYPDDDIFVMKQVILKEESYRARLQDEFRSLKLIQHDNILRVFNAGDDYYIMEFIKGIIDKDALIAHPKRPVHKYTNQDRIRIVIEAAKAIEHAHQFGVVHRVIDPGNISVDGNKNVKLIGFGLVKTVEKEGVTKTDVAVGTPNYMSRDQIESMREVSPSFDIYALGASLYHYLTGEKPYERVRNSSTGQEKKSESVQDVFEAVCDADSEPVPPSQIALGIPKVLQEIILKAMSEKKSLRYQSAREFRKDLEKYLSLADMDTRKSATYFGIEPKPVKMRVRRRGHLGTHRKTTKGFSAGQIAVACVGAATFILVPFAFLKRDNSISEHNERQSAETDADCEQGIKEMYEHALLSIQKNPFEYDRNIGILHIVVMEGRKTEYEQMANDKIEELVNEREQTKLQVLSGLREIADMHIAQNDFESAIRTYTQYNSILQEETKEERAGKAEDIKKEKGKYLIRTEQEQKKAQERAELEASRKKREREINEAKKRIRIHAELPGIIAFTAEKIRSREYEEIEGIITEKLNDKKYSVIRQYLEELQSTVGTGIRLHNAFLDHFRQHKGEEITIKTTKGTKKGRILSVSRDMLILEKVIYEAGAPGIMNVRILIKDIFIKEKIMRIRSGKKNRDELTIFYFEAESQGNTGLMEKLKERIEDCIFFL